MTGSSTFDFGPPRTEKELDEVRRLNYRTFVEEIPQHAPNTGRRLVDRLERVSTFIVARRDDAIVGMVSMVGARPFSLDAKLPDLDQYLPPGRRPCEVRLLAIEPAHRRGTILRGLLAEVMRAADAGGFDLFVICGIVRELPLYERLGFVTFGPRVGTAGAPFQPMYLTREGAPPRVVRLLSGRH